MEETTTSLPALYIILNQTVFWGGLLVATIVWRWHRRNPPDRERHTATLIARAWPTHHVGIYLSFIVLLYLLASASGRFFYEEQLPVVGLVAYAVIYTVLTTVIALMLRKRGVTWEQGFGLGRSQLHLLRLAPVRYLAAIPFLMVVTIGYNWILYHGFGLEITMQDAAQEISEQRSWLEWGYILAAVVAAPVYEELAFRGILFPFLAKRFGVRGGVLAVSVLFGLIHFHIPSILPLCLLSVVLCVAYLRTGSLWVSIGIHAIFNAVSTLAIKLVY